MGEGVGVLAQPQLSPFKHSGVFDEDISTPEPSADLNARRRQVCPEVADGVLRVMGAAELTAAHGHRFRNQVRAALNGHTSVEIDLSQTTAMDCAGLGALVGLRNLTRARNGVVRLVNPTSRVRQRLDLMRAEQVFEVVKSSN